MDVSTRHIVTAGIGCAAVFGLGLLSVGLADEREADAASPAVQLVSFDSVLAPPPLTPATDWWWLYGPRDGGESVRVHSAALTPNALAAASSNPNGFHLFRPIGLADG